jgi:hypothetical protein
MNGTTAQWRRLVVLAFVTALALTAAIVTAQQGDVSALQQPSDATLMTADRSREVQRALADIDANRTKWSDSLFEQWNRALDPNIYNLQKELGSTAMRAPAWQLYAASLVDDLRLMSRILKGRTGGARYVNTLAAPLAKVAPLRGEALSRPLLLGDVGSDLTFTPIAPCRVVDTRPGPDGAGARTGLLLNNATRNFDLEDDAYAAGQGGGFFPCPGLPTDSPAAWSINITVVNTFAAAGGLKVWGFSSPEPNASVINWPAGTSAAIANSMIVVGCDLCADDITVRAFGDNTHIIIDVMGYFDDATAGDATIFRSASGTGSIAAGGLLGVTSGACPVGTQLVSGETDVNSTLMHVAEFRASGSAWFVTFENASGSTQSADVYARCLDTPVRLN